MMMVQLSRTRARNTGTATRKIKQRLTMGLSILWQDLGASWNPMCVEDSRERANIVDVRFHDLRRSLGKWMTINGSSIPIVGKALGHSQKQHHGDLRPVVKTTQ